MAQWAGCGGGKRSLRDCRKNPRTAPGCRTRHPVQDEADGRCWLSAPRGASGRILPCPEDGSPPRLRCRGRAGLSGILSSKLLSGPDSCPVPGAGLRHLKRQPGPAFWLKTRLAGDEMVSGIRGRCGVRPARSRAAHEHPAPCAQHTQTPLPHGVSAAHRRGVPGSGTLTPCLPGVSWGTPETRPGATGWLRTGSRPPEPPGLGGERFLGFRGYL